METTMTGVQRRKKILEMLGQSSTPLSGGALGRAVGVSRQVVVQDIALLRTERHPVLATARGYVLEVPHQTERLFKMCHTTEQTREELNTIVDLGGEVLDVMVNHRIYGKVSAPLNIRSRRDVEAFVENIRTGRSTPLLNVTSGYHFHHVAADQEEILDEIEAALREKGFLADFLSYEQEEGEK
ncbi:transcription repressor NadR [Clostridium fessum]|nr:MULTISPECIES: transcription repressor NadR [Clostridium]MCC2170322.1 transcription repressor NadR [Clostridium fessum]RHQ68519.1 transcription repressor NadR [Clostridium sp. AF24-2LB]